MSASAAAVEIKHLNFAFSTSDGRRKPILHDIDLTIAHGSRNGAGKSTLLRILAGRHLTEDRDSVLMLGQPAFFQTLGVSGISFLGNSMWTRSVAFVSSQVTYEADIEAGAMMQDLQDEFMDRREELRKLLGVDLSWKLNQVSDGQRRRIQIMLGLLRPFKLLLIDEFTVDLDVLCRRDLLRYLERETERRPECTIVYCTHIFDGLEEWPTHLVCMSQGRVRSHARHTDTTRGALYSLAVAFMERAACEPKEEDAKDKQQLEEPFGGAGYSAGRIVPSTTFFPRNRHNAHKT